MVKCILCEGNGEVYYDENGWDDPVILDNIDDARNWYYPADRKTAQDFDALNSILECPHCKGAGLIKEDKSSMLFPTV